MTHKPDNVLRIGKNDLLFPDTVLDVEAIGHTTVVLFEGVRLRKDMIDCGRNVHAYDNSGYLLWKIQTSGAIGTNQYHEKVPLGYSGISVRSGRLFAKDFEGFEFDVNIDNGEVSNVTFVG